MKKKSSNNIFIWISIILVIMIIIIIGAIICIKCKRNRYNSNYYNIEGKNIPFDDEDNAGIN